jgi:hypothetical protein
VSPETTIQHILCALCYTVLFTGLKTISVVENDAVLPWCEILTTKFLPSDVMIETVSVTQLRFHIKHNITY